MRMSSAAARAAVTATPIADLPGPNPSHDREGVVHRTSSTSPRREFGCRVASGPRAAFALLALLLLSAPAATTRPAEYLQAVEFPYYLYPRTLWERELVWLKNIGIRSVEFSIPWNWHQLAQLPQFE